MLPIDLTGKRAFVAGVADDKGYGWAIARAFAEAGAAIMVADSECTGEVLVSHLRAMLGSAETLERMGEGARGLAHPDAVCRIADEIFSVVEQS